MRCDRKRTLDAEGSTGRHCRPVVGRRPGSLLWGVATSAVLPHGGSTIEERRTFVLAQGPGIAAGARPFDTRLVDVAATVFKQLGIVPDPAWGLDGKPVQERSADPFDTLYPALSGRVDETGIPAGVLGYTRTAPSGWSVINSAMGTGGVTEWRGWSFATDEFWSRSQRDQSRELNVRSRGVFAVADSDEWDDKASSGTYDSTLVTPAYAVGGKAKVRLEFTTLYRQEGSQTAQILASWNGTPPSPSRRTPRTSSHSRSR